MEAQFEKYILPIILGLLTSVISWGITKNLISTLLIVILFWILYQLLKTTLLRLKELNGSEIDAIYKNQAEAENDIRALAKTASSIDILAVRGLGIIGMNDSLLRESLINMKGSQLNVRILLLDPNCDNAKQRAQEIGESYDSFRNGIRLAEKRLMDLAAKTGMKLEIHYYETLPIWRIISIDKCLYVSVFDQNLEGHRSVMYKLSPKRKGVLYQAFNRYFNDLYLNSISLDDKVKRNNI
jgi:hypothetical protein